MPQRSVARRRFLAGIAAAQVASAQPAPPTPPTAVKLKLAVGADHAGFPLKGTVVQLLQSWGHSTDPDFQRRVRKLEEMDKR